MTGVLKDHLVKICGVVADIEVDVLLTDVAFGSLVYLFGIDVQKRNRVGRPVIDILTVGIAFVFSEHGSFQIDDCRDVGAFPADCNSRSAAERVAEQSDVVLVDHTEDIFTGVVLIQNRI